MVANKTTKPAAKTKAPVKGKAEVAKGAAKAKTVAKAPVKTKLVPKAGAKSAAGKPPKAAPATAAKTAPKSATSTKKSIVSVSAKKVPEVKTTAPAVKAKAAAPQAKPVAAGKPAPHAKATAAVKPAAPAKAPTTAAKPVQPAPKAAAPTTKPAVAQPQAKAAAPSVVLPLKKLPLTAKPSEALAAKPAHPAAPGHKPAQPVAKAPVAAPQPDPKKVAAKPANQRHGFKTNEFIVYPSHGVGKIVRIEEQVVAGDSLELFVIHFEQEKMTLRVPTAKLASVGMRKLSESGIVDRAMETLKGRARIKRTMWSRRAQEYEAKINSGDLVAIAEVVRDLYRAETQPEQSYSERQLFEAALDRMSREIAAIENLDDRGATQKVIDVLAKSAKSRKAVETAAEPAVEAGGAERAA